MKDKIDLLKVELNSLGHGGSRHAINMAIYYLEVWYEQGSLQKVDKLISVLNQFLVDKDQKKLSNYLKGLF